MVKIVFETAAQHLGITVEMARKAVDMAEKFPHSWNRRAEFLVSMFDYPAKRLTVKQIQWAQNLMDRLSR